MTFQQFVPFALALLVNNAANAAWINANDTYITKYSAHGGIHSTHGNDSRLNMLGVSGLETYPLFDFDFSGVAGHTVTSNYATVGFTTVNGYAQNASQRARLYELTTSWNETTTSWANFGGTGFNTSYLGTYLGEKTFGYHGTDTQTEFLISSSIVQNWIDNPASFNGLILYSVTPGSGSDLQIQANNGTGYGYPYISFTSEVTSEVSTPSTIPLFTLALGLLGMRQLKQIPLMPSDTHLQ